METLLFRAAAPRGKKGLILLLFTCLVGYVSVLNVVIERRVLSDEYHFIGGAAAGGWSEKLGLPRLVHGKKAAAAASATTTTTHRHHHNDNDDKKQKKPNRARRPRGGIFDNPWLQTRLREERFQSWFTPQGDLRVGVDDTDNNNSNAGSDRSGPILDFVIAGWPKCGTTTLQANLGRYAPMPIADVCTPIHKTVWYAYKLWPQQYGKAENDGDDDRNDDGDGRNEQAVDALLAKPLRGTKCPQTVNVLELRDYSKFLPKTKVIVGIRHPVLWFMSFWNQQYVHSAYCNIYSLVHKPGFPLHTTFSLLFLFLTLGNYLSPLLFVKIMTGPIVSVTVPFPISRRHQTKNFSSHALLLLRTTSCK